MGVLTIAFRRPLKAACRQLQRISDPRFIDLRSKSPYSNSNTAGKTNYKAILSANPEYVKKSIHLTVFANVSLLAIGVYSFRGFHRCRCARFAEICVMRGEHQSMRRFGHWSWQYAKDRSKLEISSICIRGYGYRHLDTPMFARMNDVFPRSF